MQDNPLGRTADYSKALDADDLFAVPRAEGRAAIDLPAPLPFHGVDLWTAYELSWLDAAGRPDVAVLSVEIPADSPNLVESKSFKLYLNAFAMTRFESAGKVIDRVGEDLGKLCGSPVEASIVSANDAGLNIRQMSGHNIDRAAAHLTKYQLDPGLLKTATDEVAETLNSHLLRSVCPVTGQPDMGSILIDYVGPRIDHGSLLAYLVSYRQHADFHELCVERIFNDLRNHCGCKQLTVYARYNRRGGIDINPFRSNMAAAPEPMRLWRQ
ncbi:MAG: NADPH-dependent 7-cyano-7-deazaguanine reductase QueF [Woeseia sp.]|nr:NADPH-dependent 7-cyano-7-deazaguanine reductase QueF [Woeseia sp.]MBT8096558.1 NADPH-dependent 7-cyano-7-deazaguanine reductase QueF [Woeseia sp.]NNE61925.1 NADPH-dependent 7-cyano-7-deazaguanine reductase QueF [Woeseia sp.]NNL56015.1 NADPH-dependent 7-cyano-7-deazaguanine reductase QueF [Woeseia sp.]